MKKTKFIFRYKFIISCLLFITIIILSIGYSAYVNELYIAGVSAEYRKIVDIRVTQVSQNKLYSNATSKNLNYNIHSLLDDITLPNSDSYIIYNIEITNLGNEEMGILDISGLDEQLDYELTNYHLKDKICNTSNACKLGITKTFQLKIFYKEGNYNENNIDYSLKLNFDFRGFHTITYHDIEGEYPTVIMDGDTLDITIANNTPDLLMIKNNHTNLTEDVEYTYQDNRLLINNVSTDLDIYSKDDTNRLLDIILMNENSSYTVKSAKECIRQKNNPNFANQATADEGLFLTTDDVGDAYYYRGAVEDNHVLFAGFCWEIIRTTGTGGIKMIYDGTPSNGKCNNTGQASYIQNSAINSNNNSPASIGYMYGATYNAISKDMSNISENMVFANDITFNEKTGEYTLIDTIEVDGEKWETEYTKVADKHHYTCFTNGTTCPSVYYLHDITGTAVYYVILVDGKKPMDILNEMLMNSTNEKNSRAKEAIDNWYKENMIAYTEKLEDTVFCNDRSIFSYGGWDKESLASGNWLYISANKRLANCSPSLICPKFNDKFTVNLGNGNGDLDYPVGLITADEIAYAGGLLGQTNTNYYLYTGTWHMWTASPYYFFHLYASEFQLYSAGIFGHYYVTGAGGLRPTISLVPNTETIKGNGSSDNPYLVE